MAEYPVSNIQSVKVKIVENQDLHVYVMNKIEGKYDPLFESKDFYDLVEGSKIFLHLNNYEFYEEQLKFAYGNKLNDTIRLFFLLKFLKILNLTGKEIT